MVTETRWGPACRVTRLRIEDWYMNTECWLAMAKSNRIACIYIPRVHFQAIHITAATVPFIRPSGKAFDRSIHSGIALSV